MARRFLPALVVAVLFTAVGATPAYAKGTAPILSVDGEVTAPSTFTTAQLAALPQTTMTVTDGGRTFTDTGVLLETLVTDAQPAYPVTLLNTKNELLRVTATVRGAGLILPAPTLRATQRCGQPARWE